MNEPTGDPPPALQPPPLPMIAAANPSAPYIRPGPNFGQQAARASWIAPLIALALGVCTLPSRTTVDDQSGSNFIGLFNLLLFLTGGVLASVALFGMRKWGRAGVLVPASVGLILFIGFALAAFATFRAAERLAAQKHLQAQAADLQRLRKEGEDAFVTQSGWFGILHHADAVITLVTVPDSTPFVAEMLSQLGTPVSVLVLSIDNTRSEVPLSVDPTGAAVHFADGTSRTMPDLVQVLRSAKTDAAEAVTKFGPPLNAQPGKQLVGRFLFLPPKTDSATIDHIALKVDGKSVDIPGRFYTAQEKQALQEAAQQQQAGQNAPP